MVANKKSGLHRVKAKQIVTEKRTPARPHAVDQASVTAAIDRRANRDRRLGADRRTQNLPVAVEHRVLQRRAKVTRRRQIDPTTCERDYTLDEIEFMSAMDEYKRRNGRMFPTCSEVLEVIKSLGYEKALKNEPLTIPVVDLPMATSYGSTVVG